MFIFFSENAKIDTCSRQTYLLLQFSRKMQEILVITSSIASPETVLSNFSISIFLPNDSPSNLGFPESLEWIGPLAPRHLVAGACVCVCWIFLCVFLMLFPTKVLAGARGVVESVFELQRAEVGTLEDRRQNEVRHIAASNANMASYVSCHFVNNLSICIDRRLSSRVVNRPIQCWVIHTEIAELLFGGFRI